MNEFQYKIFDHKWNNLKRWVECCEDRFGKDGAIAVGKMGDMIRTIEGMEKKQDDIIIEALNNKEA